MAECTNCEYSLQQFFALCGNEERLNDFLKVHGVIDLSRRETLCPRCNNPCRYYADKMRYVCNSSTVSQQSRRRVRTRCGFVHFIRKNTFFSGSRLSIEKICSFVACWTFGMKQQELERETNWSSSTVVDWVSFCREVCFVKMRDHAEILGGPGKIVEIDEAKFGKRKYNRGRIIEGQWIFGGIERETKKAFFVPVADRSSDTLLGVIQQWILPETTIMSDCWRSYDCLNDQGFQDLKVNHSLNFVDPDSGAHTHIPRFGRRSEYFPLYLAEYYFHRKFPDHRARFHQFFTYIGEVYPPDTLLGAGDHQ